MIYQMGLLTLSQKGDLEGQEWKAGILFNPVQDINDNWFISQQEMFGNENPQTSWVNSLPIQDYIPKPDPD